jgi:UDP:flavonoid glycosyltransferase YjiC (YdhE family)
MAQMTRTPSRLSRRPNGTPRAALFVSIPAIGHLNPLLKQGAELRRRGWRVAVASTEEMRAYMEGFTDLRFVNLGPSPRGAMSNTELQERASANSSFVAGTLHIMRSVNALWPTMFDGLIGELRRDRPDVMVVDLFASAGMDAAEVARVPYVVNNADVLTALSVDLLPAAPDVPVLFSGRSIRTITRVDRMLNAPLRRLGSILFDLTLGAQLNRLRRTRGLPPRRMTRRLAGVLVMIDSAFGLEYNRALPPLLQMVGPMLDDTADVELPSELGEWLNAGRPVVFVNLGTLARPRPALAEEIARALAGSEFRALWVTRDQAVSAAPNVRVEPWVASQLGVLAHPNVKVFVSHCGVNSVHESLAAGTPIVGIPMLADQRDMAMRVQDAGVGKALEKDGLTAQTLRGAILAVLHEPAYARLIAPIQSSFELAGGVRRAADLVEHAAVFGVEHYGVGWRAG